MSDILRSVSVDPATEPGDRRRASARRRRVIAAGHAGQVDLPRQALGDPDPDVQAAALSALARAGALTTSDAVRALQHGPTALRRRVPDAALTVVGPGSRSILYDVLTRALADPDPLVVVGAAWFLGERRVAGAVAALAVTAQSHADMRCREAAVAALGAIGQVAGLPAVLGALDDKPTVRRRATVALAGFDDPRVADALDRAADDRDWQVRQAADELLDGPGVTDGPG
jgi:HEAT repeat protein